MLALLAAEPLPVKPEEDWLDYTNAVIAALAAVASLLAIVIALRAQRAANRTVADERKRTFEIDVLKGLMTELTAPGVIDQIWRAPAEMLRFDFQLSLLSDPLKFWSLAASAPDTESLIELVGHGEEYRTAAEKWQEINSERADTVPVYLQIQDQVLFEEGRDLDAEHAYARLEERISRLFHDELAAEQERGEAWVRARMRFGARLAWDVQQAVLSQVDAGRQEKLTWWKRWWRYGV